MIDWLNENGQIAGWITAIVAIIALTQIFVVRRIAKNNSLRESVKFAVDTVNIYLDKYVNLSGKTFHYRKEHNIKMVKLPVRLYKFNIDEAIEKVPRNVLVGARLQDEEIEKQHEKLGSCHLDEANCLEMFAAPFVEKVADYEVGFRAVGRSFCASVEDLWFFYVSLRSQTKNEYNYFSNTIKLYNLWRGELDKNDLKTTREEIEKKINDIKINKVKSIGT